MDTEDAELFCCGHTYPMQEYLDSSLTLSFDSRFLLLRALGGSP